MTIEVRGPVAVLSGTSGKLNRWFAASCCLVPVDEGAEQTAQVLAAERRRFAHPGGGCDQIARAAIIRRHHSIQRLIACRPVVIPFAERIKFTATTLRQRGEQARFLGLVAASALLHQHQRLTNLGHVVADRRDFDIAVSLAEAAGIGADQDLGGTTAELLSVMARLPALSVTMDDLRQQRPEWTRHAFRSALAELIDDGHVAGTEGGRGRERRYAITSAGRGAAAPDRAARPSISLLPVGGLAAVGETGTDNFIPEQGSG